MNEIVKKTTAFANDVLDTFNWALKKLDSPGRNIDHQRVVGTVAEVSLNIQPGCLGQVLVVLGGTVQPYSARANNERVAVLKGAQVTITGFGQNLVYVDPIQATGNSPAAAIEAGQSGSLETKEAKSSQAKDWQSIDAKQSGHSETKEPKSHRAKH